MKLLLLIVVALVFVWLVRRSLLRMGAPPTPEPPPEALPPQAMLACAHCGMHLPADEVLPGRGGVFCGEAHRAAFERSHPGP